MRRVMHILAVALAFGLFVWRYTCLPQRKIARETARPAPVAAAAPVTVAAPEEAAPEQPAAVVPVPQPAKPQPTPVAVTPPPAEAVSATGAPTMLLQNGNFDAGLDDWSPWHEARTRSNAVTIVAGSHPRALHAVRIANPTRNLVGVQQLVTVVSGGVYRLGGMARSAAIGSPPGIFGGRIAFFLPPNEELTILWLGEHTNWWGQTRIITNTVAGVAVVTVSLGYGKVATTGDFADIKLERIQ